MLNTIARSCPNLRILDVRTCQQIDNRIVNGVLQLCEHLEVLRLDGCTRISDTAFAPALWKSPLAGLLGLRELSVGRCSQLTAEGLLGYVKKGTPCLTRLGLTCCRSIVTDEVAYELLSDFSLESLDLSLCTALTDAPFNAQAMENRQGLSMWLPRRSSAECSPMLVPAQRLERAQPAQSSELEGQGQGWQLVKHGTTGRRSDTVRPIPLARNPFLMDGAFPYDGPVSGLRELRLANTPVTDAALEGLAYWAADLEVLDVGQVMRITDRGLTMLLDSCRSLRVLCVCHTHITDNAFVAIARCPKLERLDASWCSRATPGALGILLASGDGSSPPTMKDFALDHVGTLNMACLGPISQGLVSPGLPSTADFPARSPEPPPFILPPPAQAIPPLHSDALEFSAPSGYACAFDAEADGEVREWTPAMLPSLGQLLRARGLPIEKLLLQGVRIAMDAGVLEAIAASCPALQELALSLSSPDDVSCATLGPALRAVGERCEKLSTLRLDSSLRPHQVVVSSLAAPAFPWLRSLTLVCSAKGDGLLDTQLEALLRGRTTLETLDLRNCQGLSDNLFPRWCGSKPGGSDEAKAEEVVNQLDRALLSTPDFGNASGRGDALRAQHRRRQHPKCSAALALRSVRFFSLVDATALSDRSGECLAELLHDAQTVDLRGCPQITQECLRSFKRGCRFLRKVCIVTRDLKLTWNPSSTEKKHHHHRKQHHHRYSDTSGTESN